MANNKYLSDELLAAYLEGNTNEAETLEVLSALKADPELRETLGIALQVKGNDSQYSILNSQFDMRVLPMMKLAAESGNNICSVLCDAYVLTKRNIPFEEKELLSIAQNNHWLRPEGSPLHAIGQLLAHYVLMVTRKYDATVEDISKARSLDNDVIVVVDRDKLYPELEDKEDSPNHAIVVTAVDSESVMIYDPQDNSQFPVLNPQFEMAWKESQNYMIRVLQSIDEYEPHPVNVDQIPLDGDLEELQEAIAENAHDVWAEARMKDGWTYGPVRDDANKRHPDLVPYTSLPDSEKEYDRIMAFNTIKLVKKLGFKIVKKQ